MRRAVALVLALFAGAHATDARADEPAPPPPKEPAPSAPAGLPEMAPPRPDLGPDGRPRLVWRHGKFDTADYVVTGVALGVAVGAAVTPVPESRLSGSLGVDDAVRSTLKADEYGWRRRAADLSDVGLAFSLTTPILFDALLGAWGRRGSPETAKQLVLIDVQTFAVAGAVTALTSAIVNRERPYAVNGDCGTVYDPAHRDCEASFRFRYRSFFSGHTSISFTGASLVCTHHAQLGLFGPGADAGMCVAAMATAAGTGTLRIVADKHYASDVAVGAATGLLVGFGVPWLLHYRHAPPALLGRISDQVNLVPAANGAALVGTF